MCNSICMIKHLFPVYSQIHIDRITLALLPDCLCRKVLQFNCRTENTAVAYGSYQACRFQKFGSMQSMAYETRLFKWLFSFCNAGTYSRIRFFFFFFFFFWKKAGTLIVRKISSRNIDLWKILIWVIQKVQRKEKVCFWHISLF